MQTFYYYFTIVEFLKYLLAKKNVHIFLFFKFLFYCNPNTLRRCSIARYKPSGWVSLQCFKQFTRIRIKYKFEIWKCLLYFISTLNDIHSTLNF